jgi:hypothetical protein
MIKMIDSSLREGALYRFRDPATGLGDEAKMVKLLNNFWSAVETVFTDDWDKSLAILACYTALGFLLSAV